MNQNKNDSIKLAIDLQENCNISPKQQCHLNEINCSLGDESLDGSARISTGSRESVYSSSSSSEDVSDSVSSDSSSTNNSLSGKSNRDSGTDNRSLEVVNQQQIKILNHHRTIVPAIQEVRNYVEEVRVRFLIHLQDDKADELYDSLDLEELNKPLLALQKQEQSLAFRLISRFFDWPQVLSSKEFSEKQYNEIVESLKGLLMFRKTYQLSSTRADQFCREFYLLSGMFRFGFDRQRVPVMYLRASIHRKWSHQLDESFRRYVAWQLDQVTKSNHKASVLKSVGAEGIAKDGSFGICFDCINVSYACLDLDFLRFLIRCLVHYYPTYCRYALCVDLPWLFRSVWKMVRGWLPEDAQSNVQLITAKELPDYIDENQIPTCLRVTEHLKASDKSAKLKNPLPENWSSILGIDELAGELKISSSEVKQFKAHVEKVRKEYEKLGAI